MEGALDEPLPLSAYVVKRPDDRWAVLLVNKDPEREWLVAVRFANAGAETAVPLLGPADLYQFSADQYRWRANGEFGRPLRSRPPKHVRLSGHDPVNVRLPPWSLTVVRVRDRGFGDVSQSLP